MNARTVSPVLIGRSTDLAMLGDALSHLPCAVLLGGEAGIGKSRLIKEFGARARADGARVLTGGCLELASDGLPFAPFTAVLRVLVREMGVEGIRGLLSGLPTGALARLLPEFGEPGDETTGTRAGTSGHGTSTSTGTTDGETRARLFELVLTLLERLADRAPLVLVIEDAHWADRSSRDLLTFLVRNLDPAARVLVLVSYRTDELHRDHPLRPLLAQLHRVEPVRSHELARLSREEVAELACSILDERPGAGLIEKVYTRTQGNPLFIEALLGCDGRMAGELPESLRDLLLGGVQKLPLETQELLRVASVCGVRIDHELLVTVAGLDDTELTRLLRPAVAANVLVVDGDGYVFRHALIRQAVHDDLLPGEHNRLHARYAQAIEDDPQLLSAAGRRVVTMAHHWYAAHNTTWALISAWRAAEEASRSVAHAEALDMLARVLELWDQVPEAADHLAHEYTEVLEKAVEVASLAGDYERGVRLATAALNELQGCGDGVGRNRSKGQDQAQDRAADRGRGHGDPVRCALLLERRGRMALELARDEGLDDLRAAARLLPAEPPTPERARVLSTFAQRLYFARRFDEARRVTDEALRAARLTDDAFTEANTLLTLACIDGASCDFEARLTDLELIEKIAARAPSFHTDLRVAVIRSDALEGMGAHAQAAEVARQGIADARRHGVERISGTFLAINLAEPLVSMGHWDEALKVLDHALLQEPPLASRSYLHVMAGEVKLARGDLEGAAAEAATGRAIVGSHGYKGAQDLFVVIRLEAALRLAEGRVDELLTAVRPAMTALQLPDDPRYAWPLMVIGAAGCADAVGVGIPCRHLTGGDAAGVDAGSLADPRSAFALIEGRAAKLTVHGPVQHAHRLTFEAEAARVGGRLDHTAWAAAAAAWREIGQPYAEAKALWRTAEAHLAAGHREQAAAPLCRAAELAEGLAAAPLRSAIGDLARRGRITSVDGSRPEPASGLTPREWEVLRLVSEGRSNREIAEALFISAKTASVHVSNILGKLGVGGRGEAAAAAHRLGLFDAAP